MLPIMLYAERRGEPFRREIEVCSSEGGVAPFSTPKELLDKIVKDEVPTNASLEVENE